MATWLHHGYISFFNAAGLQASLACTDGLKLDNSIINVMSKQTENDQHKCLVESNQGCIGADFGIACN